MFRNPDTCNKMERFRSRRQLTGMTLRSRPTNVFDCKLGQNWSRCSLCHLCIVPEASIVGLGHESAKLLKLVFSLFLFF